MSDIIKFRGVSKLYAENRALDNISFNIEKGEMVFLAGHSGSGKSTLLKLISGLERSSFGDVEINKVNLSVSSHATRIKIRQHIGIVFQDHKILFDRSVYDNVRLPLDIMGDSDADIDSKVEGALSSVGLFHKKDANPQELSGGEQQRLCIARAIIHQPAIILADEPTANLDRDNAYNILELFKKIHKTGVTILISAHDESILADYGKRIIRLNNGRFV